MMFFARLKAQSNCSDVVSAKSAPGPKATTKDINYGVAKLSIQEPVRVKSKNLDVAAEYKKTKRKNAANFVVIGRSTLSAEHSS